MDSEIQSVVGLPSEKTLIFPIWRCADKFYVSTGDILGGVAKWAIIQSPYTVPYDLSEAIESLNMYLLNNHGWGDMPREVGIKLSCREIRELLETAFDLIPEIMAWNVSKKDRPGGVELNTDPDYDFIDLSALARNVAHEITLDRLYHL